MNGSKYRLIVLRDEDPGSATKPWVYAIVPATKPPRGVRLAERQDFYVKHWSPDWTSAMYIGQELLRSMSERTIRYGA